MVISPAEHISTLLFDCHDAALIRPGCAAGHPLNGRTHRSSGKKLNKWVLASMCHHWRRQYWRHMNPVDLKPSVAVALPPVRHVQMDGWDCHLHPLHCALNATQPNMAAKHSTQCSGYPPLVHTSRSAGGSIHSTVIINHEMLIRLYIQYNKSFYMFWWLCVIIIILEALLCSFC